MSELVEVGQVPVWTVADRIRKARESAGMSQTDLANVTSISRRSLSSYEASATTPRRPQLVVIALATGVPVAWLDKGTMPDPVRPRQDSNLQPTVVRRLRLAAA